jgi:hypothetical protein
MSKPILSLGFRFPDIYGNMNLLHKLVEDITCLGVYNVYERRKKTPTVAILIRRPYLSLLITDSDSVYIVCIVVCYLMGQSGCVIVPHVGTVLTKSKYKYLAPFCSCCSAVNGTEYGLDRDKTELTNLLRDLFKSGWSCFLKTETFGVKNMLMSKPILSLGFRFPDIYGCSILFLLFRSKWYRIRFGCISLVTPKQVISSTNLYSKFIFPYISGNRNPRLKIGKKYG